MSDGKKTTSAKEAFDLITENETANFKITLLEKHLMECREDYNSLKEQELELRQKQSELVTDMHETLEKTKKVDEVLADSISEKIETIKTDMYTSWQESIKDAVVQQTALLTQQKLEEYESVYKTQNAIIEKQNKMINKMITNTKVIRILSYTVMAAALLIFAAIPLLQYFFSEIRTFLEEPSFWGGFILVASIIILILAVSLAILLRKRTIKVEKQ